MTKFEELEYDFEILGRQIFSNDDLDYETSNILEGLWNVMERIINMLKEVKK